MDQKIKTIWPLAFVLAALVLPLAVITLIMFSVTVPIVMAIYEFLQPPVRRRRRINERRHIRIKVLATATATRPAH